MRFAADRMLGKLAKSLRMLGYDTLYFSGLSNGKFLALANDGRILLSRNTRFVGRMAPDRLIFVEANDPKMQIKEIIRLLGLKPDADKLFSRCTVCNGLLEAVEPEDVVGRVPDHIVSCHNRYSECKGCARIYWPGSHLVRSREEITRLLGV